jgi:hypothetical protein
MPQGLCNAPATFQRFMNHVLHDLIGISCEVYLDDIAIYSQSLDEHKINVRKILDRLREYGIVASPKKTVLFADEIEFLGHYISNAGIRADPTKIFKLQNWETPQNVNDLLSFNGLVEYLAQFLSGLSAPLSVLTALTQKNAPWRWRMTSKTGHLRR